MKLSDGVGGRGFAGVVNMQACRQNVKIGDKLQEKKISQDLWKSNNNVGSNTVNSFSQAMHDKWWRWKQENWS